MNDTVWLALIVGVGCFIMVSLELWKEHKLLKRRQDQKRRKKWLRAKWSKRLGKRGN